MIIGVLEYGEVRLFDGMDEVMREWGSYARDVQAEVIVFYDADGVWLEPVLAPRPRAWFGLPRGKAVFALRRNTDPGHNVDSIGLALYEATRLAPNRHFSSLDELRARFPFAKAAHATERAE